MDINTIRTKFKLLCQVDCNKYCNVIHLAKELKVSKTNLMQFINDNGKLFSTAKRRKTAKTAYFLTIENVFLESKENPKTQEYLDFKIKENIKTIELSYYDNYGNISGVYVEPCSDELEIQYLNTLEKISTLKDKYDLKPAGYHIGGFGDSRFHKVKDGWELNQKIIQQMKTEGWNIIDSKSFLDSEAFLEWVPSGD